MVSGREVIINRGAIVAQGPIDRLVEEFFPTARVAVEIAGPRQAVLDSVRAIPGVVRVEDSAPSGDGPGRFMVESARGRDVRGELFQLAAQQKWNLLELRQVGMTLEEVFIRIVAGEENENEAVSAEAAAAPTEAVS
jgi:ABC-2 type transport system ATP-binding protein